MAGLPNSFPVEGMGTMERVQLEWFFSKFAEEYYADYLFGHMILAAYAAVPAYLTPDLLYKIWQNFGEYEWNQRKVFVHRMAVPDILLAPFCTPISYEVYQMDPNIRFRFLKWMNSGDDLWTARKPKSTEDVARFVMVYHNLPNETIAREGDSYLKEQILEAQFFCNPRAAANKYLDRLLQLQADPEKKGVRYTNEITATLKAIEQARKKEKECYSDGLNSPELVFTNLFKDGETEIWRSAILQNINTLSKLISNKNITSPELTKERNTSFDISIQVKKTKTIIVSRLDKLLPAKNVAILIGASAKDGENVNRVAGLLKSFKSWDWQIAYLTKPATKREFLIALDREVVNIANTDHLLIFLSAQNGIEDSYGHCSFQVLENNRIEDTKKSKHEPRRKEAFQVLENNRIEDTDIKKIVEAKNPASFILILDGGLSATPFWADTSKPGYAVFGYEKDIQGPGPKIKASKAFYEGLQKNNPAVQFLQLLLNESNKRTIRGAFTEVANTSLQLRAESLEADLPVLYSNKDTYAVPFGKVGDVELQVQQLLRLAGILHTSESSVWEQAANNALETFAKEKNIRPEVYEALPQLQELVEKNTKRQKPLFIFIYDDRQKELEAINLEIQKMKELLRGSTIEKYNEIKVFRNRNLNEIENFMLQRENRNRVQWVWFSGFDNNGAPLVKNEAIDLGRWHYWLGFQGRIQLVVLNTCNSSRLASFLTQVGVATAIGWEGIVTDKEAAGQGVRLIEQVVNNQPLIVMEE